ncbi:FAD-dependent oxidoreductase [Aquabacterium sp. A7-Y]|uniref:NAD(P)/FAD-dependent oxidoreductase n=1 Tax=Aquabacterium sp. A7-Y TaxID=1349605 RepID=UPI00223CDA8D|nr:FAD-dependent oxidoreductase [Aquabacterium sp. A7-Y]MCW7536648.1 FAD-dependent oxidoreductase [Aquabacterium sp. A7-Y]
MRRVAVIGSGISGLAVAWTLAGQARVTLLEAQDRFGGHAHTVEVTLPGRRGEVTHGVDTGFLVLNDRTYPRLLALFESLGIETFASEMSFSVQVPDAGLEWSGRHLGTVFAQPRNLGRPGFWRMLADIVRFNRLGTALAERGEEARLREPLGDFLLRERFGASFRDWYLLPMLASIWSCPTDQMLRFPVATMLRFCHNHGLLRITGRPQWRSVRGGSRGYVQRLLQRVPDARLSTPVLGVRRGAGDAGVSVLTARGAEPYDEVVLACHADQALALLENPSADERAVLGAIRSQSNRAVLHTDTTLLPDRRRAWAAWNYERNAAPRRESAAVCLHYLINRLQPLPFEQAVIVSLNPAREPRLSQVLAEFDYRHPVFDLAALDAQRGLPALQGQRHTWFCGAWTGYGFHEDGLRSGLDVARQLLQGWARDPARPGQATQEAA